MIGCKGLLIASLCNVFYNFFGTSLTVGFTRHAEAILCSCCCRMLDGLVSLDYHQELMRARQPKAGPTGLRTDVDSLREHHQFLREDGGFVPDDAPAAERLAARYYQKLLKEYALCDLSRYREGKVGMRWRSEKEVVSGKGHLECGAIGCTKRDGLVSYEVPFTYRERGEQKEVVFHCIRP